MPGFSLTVRGAERMAVELDSLAKRAWRPQLAYANVMRIMLAGFRKNFESEGQYFAGGWQELSSRTVATYGDHAILNLTGKLRASLGSYKRIGASVEAVEVGTTDIRVRYHQAGAEGGRKGVLLARQVIGVRGEDVEKIIALLTDWFIRFGP